MSEQPSQPTQSVQPTQQQAPAEKYKWAGPVRKGLGSMFKGMAVLLGGYLGIAAVAGYNLVKGAYNLSKRKTKSGVAYLGESLLSAVVPVPYAFGSMATGMYRIGKRKLLPYDEEDYVKELYDSNE